MDILQQHDPLRQDRYWAQQILTGLPRGICGAAGGLRAALLLGSGRGRCVCASRAAGFAAAGRLRFETCPTSTLLAAPNADCTASDAGFLLEPGGPANRSLPRGGGNSPPAAVRR